MKDLLQRLRAMSREKQSLLAMWLRAERGVTIQSVSRESAATPAQEFDSAAIRAPAHLPSPEDVENLSNEEVDSLLSAMLAAESSTGPASPGAARSTASATTVPDTDSMSDDEVAAMLAELLQQEGTR